MKYKLINSQTKEEHLCDKITIKDFDYYVGKKEQVVLGKYYYEYDNHIPIYLFTEDTLPEQYYLPVVIATNNPSLNIPQVEDEVESLAQWTTKETESSRMKRIWIAGYNKSQETYSNSDEDMIEFYEWCNYPIYRAAGELGFRTRVQAQFPEYNSYLIIDKTGYSILPKGVFLTTRELIQLWKSQRIKTVYYE